jgi:hypothetical protein
MKYTIQQRAEERNKIHFHAIASFMKYSIIISIQGTENILTGTRAQDSFSGDYCLHHQGDGGRKHL